MNRTRDGIALLILRLAGLMLAAWHGWGKVSALSAGDTRMVQGVGELGFPLPIVFAWAAALSEFAGGLLVALGLWTRIGAAFAAFTMAVAAFGRHHAHQQILASLGLLAEPKETLEGWGNPEKPLLNLLIFLTLLLTGPGKFSIDHLLAGRGRRR